MNHRQKKLRNSCNFKLGVLLVAGLINTVHAVEDSAPPPPADNTTTQNQAVTVTPPPLPPEEVQSDDSRNLPEPEVNIIHRKDATIEEYRVNGKIRYAKITPKKGKPYYLVDQDGDGVLESRHDDLKGPPPINQWILKQW